jgi:catechol 2,3-dioxygenase-like lactoylglutathione lyase family enzyme
MKPTTQPNLEQIVPSFWVNDIHVSLKFYVDGLGFEITNKWVDNGKIRWCWLQRDSTALMLQEFWKDGPHKNLPEGKVGEGVSINFICRDALQIYRELRLRGLQPSKPNVGNGMWVTQLYDPDGYKLFFESETDVPEETVFSEL